MNFKRLTTLALPIIFLFGCKNATSVNNTNSINSDNSNSVIETSNKTVIPTIKLTNLDNFYLIDKVENTDSKTYANSYSCVGLTKDAGYQLLLKINQKFKPVLDNIEWELNSQYGGLRENYYKISVNYTYKDYKCKIYVPEKEGDYFKYYEETKDGIIDLYTSDFTFDDECKDIYEDIKKLYEDGKALL